MIPNPGPGKFIVFEGIDGCGKSSQITRLKNWLLAQNKKVVVTKEPTTGTIGQEIRTILKDKQIFAMMDPIALQTKYHRDSFQHIRSLIVPNLQAGNIVLSDRYRHSTVYAASDIKHIKMLFWLCEQTLGSSFIWPDATLIFDVEPEVAIGRLRTSGREMDEMETLERLKRVREYYKFLTDNLDYPNCYLIDGNGIQEEVFTRVRIQAENLLKLGGRNEISGA